MCSFIPKDDLVHLLPVLGAVAAIMAEALFSHTFLSVLDRVIHAESKSTGLLISI
jgi:hypothetical protein